MNKRVDALERLLESKMPEEVNRLVMMIEKNRLEFLDARDDTEKQITQIESKITLNDKQQPPPDA
jgi:hypothetical protein